MLTAIIHNAHNVSQKRAKSVGLVSVDTVDLWRRIRSCCKQKKHSYHKHLV